MKSFKESELKKLIDYVKENENKGLTKIFKEYAEISGRAQGSVRNYYYKTLKECKTNEKLRKKLGISNEMFPSFILEFKTSEAEELLRIVLSGIASGKSVRAVISKMANGNEKLALRYQNKYRNLLKNDKALVLKVASKIADKNGNTINPYKTETENSEYKKLESEIDGLIKRLIKSLKEENESLIEKIEILKKENEKLKEIFKKNMREKNLDKVFLNKRKEIDAI